MSPRKRPTDFAGQTVGRWAVQRLSRSVPAAGGNGTVVYWWCRCRCGHEQEVRAGALLKAKMSGKPAGCRSCGYVSQSATLSALPADHPVRVAAARNLKPETGPRAAASPANRARQRSRVAAKGLYPWEVRLASLCDTAVRDGWSAERLVAAVRADILPPP